MALKAVARGSAGGVVGNGIVASDGALVIAGLQGLVWEGATTTLFPAIEIELFAAGFTATVANMGKLQKFQGNNAQTLVLPDASLLPAWTYMLIHNDGLNAAAILTLDATGALVDGAASIAISQGDQRILLQDGLDWYSFRCSQVYDSVSLQLAGNGAVLTNNMFWFTLNAPFPMEIVSMTYRTGAGSFTVAVQINGVNVTGLNAVAVNSAVKATTNASGANAVVRGDTITAVVTAAAGSPTDAVLSLLVRRV